MVSVRARRSIVVYLGKKVSTPFGCHIEEAPQGVDLIPGTMVLISNDDQPGVIGEVGTILGRHGVNIANFALGRNTSGAIGVVTVDEDPDATSVLEAAVDEIRRVPAIREASVIRLTSTS